MRQVAEAFRHALDAADPGRSGTAGSLTVSIFADNGALRARLADQVIEAGFGLSQAGTLTRLADDEAPVLGDIVVVEVTGTDGAVLAALARLDMDARRAGTQLVISMTIDALDGVFGCFDQSGPQILVRPSDAERTVALAKALARLPGGSLQELTGADRLALVRLTEQVHLLARRIEGFTPDDRMVSGFGDDTAEVMRAPERAYLGPPGDRSGRAQTATRRPARLPTPERVRAIIRQRQLRARFFDPELFADPAWDILLDLTAARSEGQNVCVSSLYIAACVPPTTAMRWIGQMTESGLLQRLRDPDDRRRAFVTLSNKAESAISSYFQQIDGSRCVI